MINRDRFLKWLLHAAPLALMAATPTAARADLGALVPSYFFPGTGGPGGTGNGWAALDAAASQIPITAILNPNSGPYTYTGTDPNQIALRDFINGSYATAVANLEAAGGKVVAYVYTGGGSIPLSTVEGQIGTYLSQFGPGGQYGNNLIRGFFLDGMNLTTNTISYYQELYNYIKGLIPSYPVSSYTVIGNNGDPFLNGLTPAQFLSTADILNIFEGPNVAPALGAPGYDAYPYGVNWFETYPSSRFANIIHDVPADPGNPLQSSAMVADVLKAYHTNAGYVYATQLGEPNPWSQLPSYWDQEVAELAAVPEPSSAAIVAVCGLLLAARFTPWRRGSARVTGAR